MIPFILGALVFAQLAVLGFYFFRVSIALVFVILGAFIYLWARRLGRNDEHRLLQYMLKLRMRRHQANTRKFWGAISFSPLPARR